MVSPGWGQDTSSRPPGRFMVRPLATSENTNSGWSEVDEEAQLSVQIPGGAVVLADPG